MVIAVCELLQTKAQKCILLYFLCLFIENYEPHELNLLFFSFGKNFESKILSFIFHYIILL